MLVEPEEYIVKLDQFGDSFELAEQLRDIAETVDPKQRYFLTESALHIEALYQLARSAPIKYPEPAGEDAKT